MASVKIFVSMQYNFKLILLSGSFNDTTVYKGCCHAYWLDRIEQNSLYCHCTGEYNEIEGLCQQLLWRCERELPMPNLSKGEFSGNMLISWPVMMTVIEQRERVDPLSSSTSLICPTGRGAA